MTDDDPLLPLKPPLIRPTATQLAEDRAKRLAYEDQRRRYTNAWHRRLAGLEDDPESAEEKPTPEPTGLPESAQQRDGKRRPSRARGRIHNPLQGSLDLDG